MSHSPKGYVTKFGAAFEPPDEGRQPLEAEMVYGNSYVSQRSIKAMRKSIPKTAATVEFDFARLVGSASDCVQISDLHTFLDDPESNSETVEGRFVDTSWQFVVKPQDDGIVASVKLRPFEAAPWYRLVKADFFVRNHKGKWIMLDGVDEQPIGNEHGDAVSCSAVIPPEKLLDYDNHCVTLGVNFSVAKYPGSESRAGDDAKFIVEGQPVYARKEVLRKASPVLGAMFSANWLEGGAEEVPIQDVRLVAFVLLVETVSGRQAVQDKDLATLFDLADYYSVDRLFQVCTRRLLTTRDIPAIEKLLIAQSLNKPDIIDRLLKNLSRRELTAIHDDKRKNELSDAVRQKLPARPTRTVRGWDWHLRF
ncbi:BTB and MATH domain-containing protein 36-like protein [Aphelenchoides avenae]|nr:BTB and MATH domain-containing protein 36-like protein [Aphelenchus avenae]KAH7706748.1 BTB and MATH domain-containing protein 36-like protein [Aphelenchus avenae]